MSFLWQTFGGAHQFVSVRLGFIFHLVLVGLCVFPRFGSVWFWLGYSSVGVERPNYQMVQVGLQH